MKEILPREAAIALASTVVTTLCVLVGTKRYVSPLGIAFNTILILATLIIAVVRTPNPKLHVDSPFITLIGLMQIILALPWAYALYYFIFRLEL